MLQKEVATFECSWCGEIITGTPVMHGKALVICDRRAHYLRQAKPARFERAEEAELIAA
jgi:hypothetical protein